jgi:hypothetical protein
MNCLAAKTQLLFFKENTIGTEVRMATPVNTVLFSQKGIYNGGKKRTQDGATFVTTRASITAAAARVEEL